MPFDALTMAAVADEIAATALDGQIQKILQPAEAAIALSVYAGGVARWLVLSADARYARVSFAPDRLAKGFAQASPFVMLLRKHLEGTRLRSITQPRYERVLELTAGPPDRPVRLIAEVMGKHSNALLVGEAGTILGALKIVPPRQSRVRPILPGRPYAPPPARAPDAAWSSLPERPNPLDPAADLASLLVEAGDRSLGDALLGLLPGASPFLVKQIALRAGYSEQARVMDSDPSMVAAACRNLYSLYRTRAWQPHTFRDARGRPDFAAFRPLELADPLQAPTMSAAIESALGGHESRDALASIRRSVLAEIERARRAAAGRAASLREGLAAAEEAATVRERGQLLLAYQYLVRPGDRELTIPDLDMTIPLDPALTANENAERLFRRYAKLREAGRRIPGLLQAAEADEARLADLAVYVRLADSEGTLRDLSRELRPLPETETRKKSTRRGPPRYVRGDLVAVVGRSARENEEVTFRLARRDDLWLHARERTGAHVILPGGMPSEEEIQAAAALAGYFSEGRQDTRVDVDVALVRDVRKIPAGPPGRVTYRNFRTITVAPSVDGWQPARREK